MLSVTVLAIIWSIYLQAATTSIAGLTYRDKLPQRYRRTRTNECDSLYWYPQSLPDYCYEVPVSNKLPYSDEGPITTGNPSPCQPFPPCPQPTSPCPPPVTVNPCPPPKPKNPCFPPKHKNPPSTTINTILEDPCHSTKHETPEIRPAIPVPVPLMPPPMTMYMPYSYSMPYPPFAPFPPYPFYPPYPPYSMLNQPNQSFTAAVESPSNDTTACSTKYAVDEILSTTEQNDHTLKIKIQIEEDKK